MALKLQTLIAVVGISLLFSSVLNAGPNHKNGHNKFMKFFDTNRDNTVTHEEFLQASKSRFERMDTDNNGIVNEQEFRSYMQTRRQQRQKQHFEKMDADKDGTINRDEFLTASRERALRKFNRMDRDGNGLLSGDELANAKKHRRHFGKQVFLKLDADGNGQVTREESQAAWGKWFQRMDSNGDRVVTGEEIEQARPDSH